MSRGPEDSLLTSFITQAYKRAALKYHPDKASAGERDEAEKKFKQVNAANTILSDPAKRQRYDAGKNPFYPLLRKALVGSDHIPVASPRQPPIDQAFVARKSSSNHGVACCESCSGGVPFKASLHKLHSR